MVSRHTHTHTPPLAPVNIFPLWSTYTIYWRRGEPTNNGDDFDSITTIGAQTKLSSERYTSVSVDNQGNVSGSSWMLYQINDLKNKTKQKYHQWATFKNSFFYRAEKV